MKRVRVRFPKLALAIILALFAGALMGCGSIKEKADAWLTDNRPSRSFLVRPVWVRQGPEESLIKFRKINRAQTLLAGEMVLQMNAHDGLVAYTLETGKELWRLPILNGIEASATIIRDRLFFGALDGQVYSVDIKTGAVVWTFPTRTENLAEPLLVDGVLYLQSGSNSVFALDAATGKQLWIYARQDPSALSIRGGSKPAFRNGVLYVGFSDGSLVALLAQNGAVKWERALSKNKKFRDIDSTPLIDGDFLYVLGFDDAIHCLRVATGEPVWRQEPGGYGQALISGDYLYYPSSQGEMIALNKETGRPVWSYKLKEGIPTSASLYRGLVVFGESQGSLVFLDAKSGRKVGEFEPGRGIMAPPLVDEKSHSVFVMSNESNLYRIEAKWDFSQRIPYLR